MRAWNNRKVLLASHNLPTTATTEFVSDVVFARQSELDSGIASEFGDDPVMIARFQGLGTSTLGRSGRTLSLDDEDEDI